MDKGAVRLHDFACSHCERRIAFGEGHYHVYYDVRRLGEEAVEIDFATTNATMCAKCSLIYDLTRLLVPTVHLDYSREPLSGHEHDALHCADCGSKFVVGQSFHSIMILSDDIPGVGGEPTLEISFCSPCAEELELRGAEPPVCNPGQPDCYECGKHLGFKADMMAVDPANFEKLHSRPIKPRWDGKVYVCPECFFGEVSAEDLEKLDFG